MHVWVDADACPVVIRDILFRAAGRRQLPVTLVANQPIPAPRSPWIQSLQVASGFDVADQEIVRRARAGDLVITADIPLAAEVLQKKAFVLSPRGERYTEQSIGAKLNMRDFMETLRASGVQTGGPPPLGTSERKAFADELDRLVTRHHTPEQPDEREQS
ncbi:YaiI/YqxD family protein [Methylonatrum kenyense]|uniref:YaiI/YqxD family protein n=1 Tax=Methylonatrum kenyense TaxID=455253 RepID=UPI0020BE6F78|nr:YaiI/YqxD family protein [Methylonatrum kenyense]MCK8517155.1 YaiI/YqxD family protein [Methylonatrum kenyense]